MNGVSCLMGFTTCIFILATSIAVSSNIVFWIVALKKNVSWSTAEVIVLVWNIFTEIFLGTVIIMLAPYDSIFRFIGDNCGTMGNEQPCCLSNVDCFPCCTWWKRVSREASFGWKVAWTIFTALNLLATYIYAYTEQEWQITDTFAFT